jgi:hypothetical protein
MLLRRGYEIGLGIYAFKWYFPRHLSDEFYMYIESSLRVLTLHKALDYFISFSVQNVQLVSLLPS